MRALLPATSAPSRRPAPTIAFAGWPARWRTCASATNRILGRAELLFAWTSASVTPASRRRPGDFAGARPGRAEAGQRAGVALCPPVRFVAWLLGVRGRVCPTAVTPSSSHGVDGMTPLLRRRQRASEVGRRTSGSSGPSSSLPMAIRVPVLVRRESEIGDMLASARAADAGASPCFPLTGRTGPQVCQPPSKCRADQCAESLAAIERADLPTVLAEQASRGGEARPRGRSVGAGWGGATRARRLGGASRQWRRRARLPAPLRRAFRPASRGCAGR